MGSVNFRKNITKIYLVGLAKGGTLNICVKGNQNTTNDGGILAVDYYGNKLKVKPEDNSASVYVRSPKSKWVYIGKYLEHESGCCELGTQIILDKLPTETVYECNTFRKKTENAISLAVIVKEKINENVNEMIKV
jgi:hypothetical protein